MKIKLKDKDKPISEMLCFNSRGFCQTTLDKINSGKEVEVERVPNQALNYVEEIKKATAKKQSVGQKTKKGDK